MRYSERMENFGTQLARGICRHLRASGYATLTEFTLRTRRRVDVIALSTDGSIVIVEVKSSHADFRSDRKWDSYLDYCDQFFFAVPPEFSIDLIPQHCGLMRADAWDAAVIRPAPVHRLNASRRKALTIRFARAAGLRLQDRLDPALTLHPDQAGTPAG
ncbi:MAG: MmcB family DNA repair protein [Alphaproteobacteria bacterium]|nr:MmcB family DNA repair protein [Alphaproteobacteria bacterium]